ncbi:MAG: acyl-CoA dehydrogenase family protein [Nitrospirae bacterium]|nr:acyl-CoA dehydrogenase family protein [Nitrospirota bacterium]
MDFSFTPEQEALRRRIEAFCKKHLPRRGKQGPPPAEGSDGYDPEFHRKMAAAGLLSLGWPKEYGGEGLGRVAMAVFSEVVGLHEAPVGAVGTSVGLVGQSLFMYGSDEQKRDLLPRIARGEIVCALGITEPNAGSDAAACRTKAVLDGDVYRIAGSKIFVSSGHIADFILTLTRTDPNVPKHKGLTLFLVPTNLPGFKANRIKTMSGWVVSELQYDQVPVPPSAMVGGLNQGWVCLTKSLGEERTGLGGTRNMKRLLGEMIVRARETTPNGRRVWEDDTIRRAIAEFATKLEIARLLYYQAAWLQENKLPFDIPAAISKLFTSELYHECADVGGLVLGPEAQVTAASPSAPLRGKIEYLHRHCPASTIGGGTTQIQKNIIAIRGLGLPSGKE